MALVSDYFLLYHGVHFEAAKEQFTLDFANTEEEKLQSFALLLMISRKAFDKFSVLTSFDTLCRSLNVSTPKDLSSLHTLQYNIIYVLMTRDRREDFKKLQETFRYLLEEEMLPKEHYKKLLSLFSYEEALTSAENSMKNSVEKVFSFPKEKEGIYESIEALQNVLNDLQCCQDVKAFLDAQKFSIGITGVMNAGKSTMINALMGREVLGTSVVPETANLTLLKYSKTPSAKVRYWNQREWQNILKASQEVEAMKVFVDETTTAFENGLEDYILENSKEEEISIADLPSYTSAEHSGKKCNLVKNVVLETDLSFLKEGVEIVDTPGLDDPVIQREEITKSYISSCDMLLHLMNVSQSATQTDVAFIIDALLYQNISKLVIVLTRADTVSQLELDEVIAYTKASMTSELKRQNRESKLDDILANMQFLAISGKMALTCRTEPEKAKEEGLSLEKSGILDLEEELTNTLFGPNAQKSQLFIRSAKSQLLEIVKEKKTAFTYRLELASKDKETLVKEWETFLLFKEERQVTVRDLKEALLYDQNTFKDALRSLTNFIHSEFYSLETVVRERVIADVRYSYEKTKKVPESSRIEVIVQTAFKDGIIDIVRDYRYKLSQDLEALDEKYSVKYKKADLKKENIFDTEVFFEEEFQTGFLTHNIDLPVQNILKAVKNAKAKEMTALDAEVKTIVQEMFTSVKTQTTERLEVLSLKFIDKLMQDLGKTLVAMQKKMSDQEESLKTYLEEPEHEKSTLVIHSILKALTQIETKLKGSKSV